jgi:cell wall-associated NlpC family hydrolase
MKSIIFFLSIVGAFVFLPPNLKPLTKVQLQNNYLDALMSYEGADYSTSGDRWGVSCSSLARNALNETSGIDETFSAEIQSNACKSDQIAKGCYGALSVVVKDTNLNDLDYQQIEVGDVAVVGNKIGVHTLIYTGNKKWIHADPYESKVIISEAPSNGRWFSLKARIMRWSVFSNLEKVSL